MCSGCVVGPLGVTLGCAVVTQVLHEVHMDWGGCPGVVCRVGSSVGVKTEEKGLGQPRQVTTSGTHGPSRQLIFNLGGRCEAVTT